MEKFDFVIVGAGAAGLFAASLAAEGGAKVLVVERMKQAGRKLLITGKGRCNITNVAPHSEFYRSIFPKGKFLKHAFSSFFADDMVQFFNNQGLNTTVERGGRVFPESNKSADVVSALMNACRKNNVKFLYESEVTQILTLDSQINGIIINKNGSNQTISCKNVLLATGGKSYPATGSNGSGYVLAQQLGHSIQRIRPALVPLVTQGSNAKELQGLSLKNVNAVLWVNNKKVSEEFGEMLFTHYGLSGPIILTLSRMAVDELFNKNKVSITIDLKPALDEKKLDARLIRDLDENGKKQINHIFKLWLPSKMIPLFLKELQIDGQIQGHQLKSEQRKKILLLMKNFSFTVIDHLSWNDAIITAGGVSLDEIQPSTMESKLVKNLYFAGEIIDLDGVTGGYNLQIAWSTAWLAAKNIKL